MPPKNKRNNEEKTIVRAGCIKQKKHGSIQLALC